MTGTPRAGRLLPDWDARLPWKHQAGSITATETLQGHADTDLLVVHGTAPTKPTQSDLQAIWKRRSSGGVAPILVDISYPTANGLKIVLLGLDEDAVPIYDLDADLVERLIADALTESSPTRLDAEFRRRAQSMTGGSASGLRNEGLLATHVLTQIPEQAAWAALTDAGRPLLGKRGTGLLEGLGYTLEAIPDGTILREKTAGHRRAAAVLLNDGETFENPLVRLAGTNAVTHGLALARRENLDWLVVVNGPVARLYPVSPDKGVGRKGQTQTYVEVDLSLLRDDMAGYLPLLFAPEALAKDGYVDRLLEESSRFATGLAARLRDRIYDRVINHLAIAVAKRFDVAGRAREEQREILDEAYHQSMIILFRLLFVAYAEDRGLLPYERSERYTRNSLKRLAMDMVESPGEDFSVAATTLWDDLTQVWKVIDTGDLEGWGVPPYNGGLFTRDAGKNQSGAATYELDLKNAEIGPVLRGLLIDVNEDGVLGPVDFRSLSVREFGTIYEGLLESGLGVAETDITIDDDDNYVPAEGGDVIAFAAGDIYFHSKSGSRKATGSYFTKPFAVEHLLNSALEPAIDTHLARVKALLDAGKNRNAAEALFDFRVTDLSMGSAHFLVAAIDRIEARFSAFLATSPMPEVLTELDTLRTAASGRLGLDPDEAGIDDAMLLRRQIARRCVYGIDINEIAVELARLGLWIHTFVPGLPLSFLNHGLVHGNSLTGVGTLDEIDHALQESEARETKSAGTGNSMLLGMALDEFMSRAGSQLDRLSALADASVADVAAAGAIQAEIQAELAPLAALCDLITAERTTRHLKRDDPEKIMLSAGGGRLFAVSDAESLEGAVLSHPHLERARQISTRVNATHLPVAFPEVFRRAPSGFDVVLGNPPWEKLHVEEDTFWTLRFPGLRSTPQGERLKIIADLKVSRDDLYQEFLVEAAAATASAQIVGAGPFPGIGAAHLDLFAAFAWRFWHEVRPGGRIGVVLPRAALSGAATGEWRKTLLGAARIELTTLVNNKKWIFDQIHPQYTIALLTIERTEEPGVLVLRGPFSSLEEYDAGMSAQGPAPAEVTVQTVLGWSETAAVPLVPSADVDVFAQMKKSPSLDSKVGAWRFRPVQGDSNTTKQKEYWDFSIDQPMKSAQISVWSGRAFNLWSAGTGDPYAYADARKFRKFLTDRKPTQTKLKSSALFEMPADWKADPKSLPMDRPRIVFRDVCRSTDSRTMICALAPAGVALVEKAGYLLRLEGDQVDESYLLGVLSSIPFDWFSRRIVELKMSFELLNTFPIPRVDPGTGFRVTVKPEEDQGPDLRPIRDRVARIAGRLAATDDRYSDWAQAVGVGVGGVDNLVEKNDLLAELDALVAILFGLDVEQLERVFATFHRGWKYQDRLHAVLAHYRAWSTKIDGGN